MVSVLVINDNNTCDLTFHEARRIYQDTKRTPFKSRYKDSFRFKGHEVEGHLNRIDFLVCSVRTIKRDRNS